MIPEEEPQQFTYKGTIPGIFFEVNVNCSQRLLNASSVLEIMLSISYALFSHSCHMKIWTIIIPILYVRKLRLRKCGQIHIAR